MIAPRSRVIFVPCAFFFFYLFPQSRNRGKKEEGLGGQEETRRRNKSEEKNKFAISTTNICLKIMTLISPFTQRG